MYTKNFPENRYEKTDTKKNKYEKLSFGKEMLCVAHQKNPRKKFTRDIGSSSTEPGIRKKLAYEKLAYEKYEKLAYEKLAYEKLCPNEFQSPGPSPGPEARAQARKPGPKPRPKPGPSSGPSPDPRPGPSPGPSLGARWAQARA